MSRLTSPCSRQAAAQRRPRREHPGPRPAAEGKVVWRLIASSLTGVALLTTLACSGDHVLQEPPRYSTTAREQGLDSDQRIWEAERYPNVSVLRATPDRQGSALGYGLLMQGCCVQVAQVRGFQYFVVLERSPAFSHPGQGSSWDTVVGFTNEPAPDIARTFPEYYDPRAQYRVQPADLYKLFAGSGAEEHGK